MTKSPWTVMSGVAVAVLALGYQLLAFSFRLSTVDLLSPVRADAVGQH
jgi:hypothetical protein